MPNDTPSDTPDFSNVSPYGLGVGPPAPLPEGMTNADDLTRATQIATDKGGNPLDYLSQARSERRFGTGPDQSQPRPAPLQDGREVAANDANQSPPADNPELASTQSDLNQRFGDNAVDATEYDALMDRMDRGEVRSWAEPDVDRYLQSATGGEVTGESAELLRLRVGQFTSQLAGLDTMAREAQLDTGDAEVLRLFYNGDGEAMRADADKISALAEALFGDWGVDALDESGALTDPAIWNMAVSPARAFAARQNRGARG